MEWNCGMECWTGIQECYAYLGRCAHAQTTELLPNCGARLPDNHVLYPYASIYTGELRAMASRGSGTVESPITLSDSPPRKSSRTKSKVRFDSPVKVLEGEEFR